MQSTNNDPENGHESATAEQASGSSNAAGAAVTGPISANDTPQEPTIAGPGGTTTNVGSEIAPPIAPRTMADLIAALSTDQSIDLTYIMPTLASDPERYRHHRIQHRRHSAAHVEEGLRMAAERANIQRREQLAITRYHMQLSRWRCMSDSERIHREEYAEDLEELEAGCLKVDPSYEGAMVLRELDGFGME